MLAEQGCGSKMNEAEGHILRNDHFDADEKRAFEKPWSLPLLESLLRREVFEAESCEMGDWYLDLMEEIDQEFNRPFRDLESGTGGNAAQVAALRVFCARTRKLFETLEP